MWSLISELTVNWSCGRIGIKLFIGWDGQHNTGCILEEESTDVYEVNLSSSVWSAGGLVACGTVWWGNCSRMYIELPMCHVRTTAVCIATDRQNKSIIRMSAINDYQLRQVCLSVFLSTSKNWATSGRIFVKCNKYIYIFIYKQLRKSVKNSSVIKLWEECQ